METRYNHREIEKKWRKRWETVPVNVPSGKKFYCLDMFPYPSASGIHVGHWRGYTLSDVLSRYKILQGYEVLHPMGWDAFGLPAENYAIKMERHPEGITNECIAAFKRQLKEMSTVFDWSRELTTTDPKFYKWTQWIFVQMFKKGLAYEKEMPLNWCSTCNVVLANEEASGGTCERCGAVVTKKNLRQWMLKITDYADRLLEDLEGLDWPEKVKKMQADWIGKSYGAEVDFAVKDSGEAIKVFTTRPDTLFGATFIVLSPEHALVKKITKQEKKQEMEKYIFAASTKSSVDRMASKEKTGVFTGSYGINPLNGALTPVWVSDYVLSDYGTGAIMCVPAHDDRDYEFAKKFSLPIIQVIKDEKCGGGDTVLPYAGEGVMVNSAGFNGIPSLEAKEKIADYITEKGLGKKTVNYKLRDWVFSRQRYWGEPIPLIHCEHCGVVPVPEEHLPVELPYVESYLPSNTGESPLSNIDDWVNTTCPSCGKPAKRETNTMPQWAGSSWYFLRYADVNNDRELISKEACAKWLPVDYYVGGIEHAVLHLLYARFYTKFLYDIGVVDFTEPFKKLFNQGMINKDGFKMSKSKGNAVSPDETVEKYGCDALRLYELFIGPPELDSEWDDNGIEGVYRFLTKAWKLVCNTPAAKASKESERLQHKLIHDITARIESLGLNTVVSGFMEFVNKMTDLAKTTGGADKAAVETFIVLLAPFAPHIAEEMWEATGHKESVFRQSWPTADASKMKEDVITIVVQINGKVRENMSISADTPEAEILQAAKEAVAAKIEGQTVVKEIYVPGRLVNLVCKAE